MKKSKIETILVKFLNNEADYDDLTTLEFWLKNKENEELFNQYVKTQFIISSAMDEFDIEKAKLAIKGKQKILKRKRSKNQVLKYAAVAAILICLAIPLAVNFNNSNWETSTKTIADVQPGTTKATLTLEDGSNIILEKGQTYASKNTNASGTEIIYTKTAQDQKADTSYNYLTVPRGGEFFLRLSDGTQVWLNSESKLKYPTAFANGEERKIELLYGEAYFDVSKSEFHDGASFHVKTRTQNVYVLGTEFNIKAYDGENAILTTLVEGSVAVANDFSHKTLKPGQQSELRIENDQITIAEVDIDKQIAWKKGLFVFEDEPLEIIMTRLGRWYNFEISFQNNSKRNQKFSGKLRKRNTISDLLTKIEGTGDVSFQVEGNTIIVE